MSAYRRIGVWRIGVWRVGVSPCRRIGMVARVDVSRVWRDRGRDDDSGRPSLRTGQANFWHPALQLVVTSKKIGKPQHAPVLRRTSQPW